MKPIVASSKEEYGRKFKARVKRCLARVEQLIRDGESWNQNYCPTPEDRVDLSVERKIQTQYKSLLAQLEARGH